MKLDQIVDAALAAREERLAGLRFRRSAHVWFARNLAEENRALLERFSEELDALCRRFGVALCVDAEDFQVYLRRTEQAAPPQAVQAIDYIEDNVRHLWATHPRHKQ